MYGNTHLKAVIEPRTVGHWPKVRSVENTNTDTPLVFLVCDGSYKTVARGDHGGRQ
jgi:hypothetical protein